MLIHTQWENMGENYDYAIMIKAKLIIHWDSNKPISKSSSFMKGLFFPLFFKNIYYIVLYIQTLVWHYHFSTIEILL